MKLKELNEEVKKLAKENNLDIETEDIFVEDEYGMPARHLEVCYQNVIGKNILIIKGR